MFQEELVNVLENVPYNVWEKVIDKKVNRVMVYHENQYLGSGSRKSIMVYIKSGLEDIYIEGLDSVDQRNATLICSWKPYRDLMEREIQQFNHLLKKPVNYMDSLMTEEEFDDRLNRLCSDRKDEVQLFKYIIMFGLKPILKKKCYDKSAESNDDNMERNIKETALDLIIRAVLNHLNQNDDQISDTEFESTDSIHEELERLAMYCKDVLNVPIDDKQVRNLLKRFLGQRFSLAALYNVAERTKENALYNFSKKEIEYIRALEMDEKVRMAVLSLNYGLEDSLVVTGENYKARGFLQGMFYTLMDIMYECYIRNNGKVVPNRIKKNGKKSDIVWTTIKETADIYQNTAIVPFEKVENEVIFDKIYLHNEPIRYVAEIPSYDVRGYGSDKEEAIKELKREFAFEQEKQRIKKCLSSQQ